ncbi:MAG: tRNA pseudouridine(55) synthase TruB [bacterium]|nr:tRNA pseudouridine(55) synthase TruB [bacterium]
MGRIVAIHKPVGMTSHDVIDRVRAVTKERRVGHAGTLDPAAEGVLVVAIGRDATKQLSSVVAKEKEYCATIKFGATSSTDDREGAIKEGIVRTTPSRVDVELCIKRFVGTVMQVPPAYSALKVKGVPAYARARRGEVVVLGPRSVHIYTIDIVSYEYPVLVVRVVCGPGVYIRSLARDIGECLGVGGYLLSLLRTRVGDFTIEEAIAIDALKYAL